MLGSLALSKIMMYIWETLWFSQHQTNPLPVYDSVKRAAEPIT